MSTLVTSLDLAVRRYERWLVPVLVFASFAVQLITLRPPVVIGEPYFIAQNIINGLGYAYPYPGDLIATVTAYIPPLYVWLILGVLKAGGGLVAIQVINLIFLQLANYTVYRIFRELVDRGIAFVGYFALSFYIPLWLLASAIEPNMLNHALLSLTVFILLSIYRDPLRKKLWATLGIVIGVQMLVRPDMLMGVLFVVGWLLIALKQRVNLRGVAVRLSLAIVLVLLCVSPWTTRNYFVFGRFIFVSANAGYNLFIGNNPGATGEFAIIPDTPEEVAALKKVEREASIFSALRRDDFYFATATEWIKDNPVNFAGLTVKKIYYHWWRRLDSGSGLQMKRWMIVYDVVTLSLLVFGFYGLWQLRNKPVRWLFLALFAYSTAVSALFFVQSRHRALKVDPYLIPLAASGVFSLAYRRKQGHSPEQRMAEREPVRPL